MIIEKYVAPTNLDTAKFGSIWRAIGEDHGDIYIQLSKDTNAPDWHRFGSFLEHVFYTKIHDESFIKSLLDEYYKNR